MQTRPLWAHLLLFPRAIEENLARVERARVVEVTPNSWQVLLGIARMWHRVLFRSETIGTSSDDPVRDTWRARLFARRALRFPGLLAERAIAPLDFSGLASPPERVLRHLLGAHHDGPKFVYDFALLSLHPGRLDELQERARAVVDGTDPRASWLRDLVVYEGYHERLLAAVDQMLTRGLELSPSQEADPDVSFSGYLRWCAAQPQTPEETFDALRRGEYSIADGRREAPGVGPRAPEPGPMRARA